MEEAVPPQPEFVRLKCVAEGRRLRVKIISPGYSPHANCQFPKDIRVDGREYTVPKADVKLADMRGKFFYRVGKKNITIHDDATATNAASTADLSNLKVYGEENLAECVVCMTDTTEKPELVFLIFAPCGHYCCCSVCAKKLQRDRSRCPMCRSQISQLVSKDQLQ